MDRKLRYLGWFAFIAWLAFVIYFAWRYLPSQQPQALSTALLINANDSKTAIITAICTGAAAIIAAFAAASRTFNDVRKMRIELEAKGYSEKIADAEKRQTATDKELAAIRQQLQSLLTEASGCKVELAAMRERHVTEREFYEKTQARDQATIAELREENEKLHAEVLQLKNEVQTFRDALAERGYFRG